MEQILANRFEVVMEPWDRWAVWDELNNLPAEHSGVALCGLSRPDALLRCDMLNRTSGSDERPADPNPKIEH